MTTADNDGALWYKDAIIYELHVRAFYDSSADGVGDFCGLTKKLDYLQDLGVTAIWLLPFYPSPLQDDGYDIADYTEVHPAYGSLQDFKVFLKEAHRRGLKVITELVLNHTSDQHPWFQRARRAKPGSAARNFYVWSDSPEKYEDARIIFKDYEASNWSWDPVANAYYWHRFYAHQPDLNFDNPEVRKAILKVVDFWLRLGVDGLRLDAVPYLIEREGTTGENLPQTHVALRRLRRHIDDNFKDRMLLAEANQWPEEAVAYFGEGDECHMAFHFPLMPRLFMALRMGDRFPVIDILDQTPEIPDNAQWALFLRNHDELTLEMVTDEERIYMYQTYARESKARINLGIRRRLAPLLQNNRRKIELLNGLLFSLPGTPVLYYGDEIGMGDNIFLGDRDGVRTPMQWSADRNAGFSRANPQQLFLPLIVDHEYHHESVHVEAQQSNSSSLLWWMKRLIALRKRYLAFGRGSITFLHPENQTVLAFVRRYDDECILVVANLSRFLQYVELDLAEFQSLVPVELFGRTSFPSIGESYYPLTLGPYAFYWFALEPQAVAAARAGKGSAETPTIVLHGEWAEVLRGETKGMLEDVLPAYMIHRNWFAGHGRVVLSAVILESVAVPVGRDMAYLTFVRVNFTDGEPQEYLLPLASVPVEQADELLKDYEHAIVARLQWHNGEKTTESLLYDALWAGPLGGALLGAIAARRHFQGNLGVATAASTAVLKKVRGVKQAARNTATLHAKHNNTSIVYDEKLILKLFRCVDEGRNPDLEISRFLMSKGFAHIPQIAGSIEYRRGDSELMTLAILQKFVPHVGDGWEIAQAALDSYHERVERKLIEDDGGSLEVLTLLDLAEHEAPEQARELIGDFLDIVQLLGRRTAELHLALGSGAEEPGFAPRPFTTLYQRSLYQSLRSVAGRVFYRLRGALDELPKPEREQAQTLVDAEQLMYQRFQSIAANKIDALRIRVHGDYHLGQVLYTGEDFVIFDFEGQPARSVLERRLLYSPLVDIASMLRSFHYAAMARYARKEFASAAPVARFWVRWTSAMFLRGYLKTKGIEHYAPRERGDLQSLLELFMLEKAIRELGYELDNRRDWIWIPLFDALGLLQLDN